MATIYIASNANSGTGTLRAALASAESGDVIQPDPAVFPRGTNCVVPIASVLSFSEGVTVDGSQTRIVIDGSSMTPGNTAFYDGTTFRNVDFVQLTSQGTGAVLWFYGATTFEACRFYGNDAARGVFYVRNNASVNCVNCVIAGNRGTNDAAFLFRVADTTGATFTNCTIIGNVSPTGAQWNREPTLVNCKTTTAGLVSAAELSFDDWTADAWQSWNLRFKSPAEDGARGATGELPSVDLDGNPRIPGGALGAYEALAGVDWSGTTLGLTNATIKNLTFAPSTVNIAGVNVVEYFPLNGTLNFAGGALGVEFIVGEATLTGTGYFALPPETSREGISYGDVLDCNFGAGVTAFQAKANRSMVVSFSVTKSANVPVLIEKYDGAWNVVSTETDTVAHNTTYRVYDGEKFLTSTARVDQHAPFWFVESWGEKPNEEATATGWGVSPNIEH